MNEQNVYQSDKLKRGHHVTDRCFGEQYSFVLMVNINNKL
jgi:hypothetical protein